MYKICKVIALIILYKCLEINALNSVNIPKETILPMQGFDLSITETDIDDIVNNSLQLFNVPGAAVGLVIKNKIVLSRGYGICKVYEELPVTEHTLFPIGSCTKAFTAFILGQLVDEGKIAFDDPVRKYIPEFSLLDQDVAEKLTIRDLLAHRTGITRHDPIWVYLEFPRSKVIELLKNLEPACGLRQEFQYNNFMYVIAGIIIERVTGQSWEDALSTRLLEPLKMKGSNMLIEQLKTDANASFPHAEIDGIAMNIPFRNLYSINPAGGINSNIVDMIKWVRLQLLSQDLLHTEIIRSETLQEMQTTQISIPSRIENEEIYQTGYGLGWLIGKYRGHDWVNHGGSIDGFFSDVSLLPAEGIGLIILTNSSSDGHYFVSSVRNQIIDKMLKKETTNWITKIQETRNKDKQLLQESLRAFERTIQVTYPVHSLKDYTGSYEHPSYGIIELNIEHNHLVASYGKMRLSLHFKSESVFTGQSSVLLAYGVNPIIDFAFIKNASGDVYQVQVPFEGFRSNKPITFTLKATIKDTFEREN